MRKILITGGAGFVGRHFVKHFLERGDEVHAVDCVAQLTGGIDPDRGWPLFEPRDFSGFKFFREDCRDFFKRPRVTDYDYSIHLAAMVGGRAMIENNPIAVADDLSIDAEYWQWAKLAKPAKTLCFTSSAAYPIKYQRARDYVLLREDMISFDQDIGMPDMSYGWAKLTCEYLARLAYQKHGLKSVCYRPFSGYGEDQDNSYPVPSICKRALANKGAEVLEVWGSGTQMRDFIHIDDCVVGAVATMDKIDDGDAGESVERGSTPASSSLRARRPSFAAIRRKCAPCPTSRPGCTPAAATRRNRRRSASPTRSISRPASGGSSIIIAARA